MAVVAEITTLGIVTAAIFTAVNVTVDFAAILVPLLTPIAIGLGLIVQSKYTKRQINDVQTKTAAKDDIATLVDKFDQLEREHAHRFDRLERTSRQDNETLMAFVIDVDSRVKNLERQFADFDRRRRSEATNPLGGIS